MDESTFLRFWDRIDHALHRVWERWLRGHIRDPLTRQRLKLLWDWWGYWPLLRMESLRFRARLGLAMRFMVIDWNVLHGHRAVEIATVCAGIGSRRARPGETVVEAGCWKGGSSAKFSLLCAGLGYRLHVFDSFKGVEERTELEGSGFDFSGSYAAAEREVRANIERYGADAVVTLTPGWFAETIRPGVCREEIRAVFIDCDLAKGNREVLEGSLDSLVDDGVVFTHDFHIDAVRDLLRSEDLWRQLGRHARVEKLARNLARIRVS